MKLDVDVAGAHVLMRDPGLDVSQTVHALVAQGARVDLEVTMTGHAMADDLAARGLLRLVTAPDLDKYDVILRRSSLSPCEIDGARGTRAGIRGSVTLVGGGPGDPELLTLAGLRALRGADVVVCDRLAPLAHLAGLPSDVEIVHVGKIPRGAFTPQQEINSILIERARAGQAVVRLKGGDGFVFGRGGEEWNACIEAGIPVHAIPGVTSAIAAPALAGIPVTHRDLTQGFIVVSGHVPPGDARSSLDWQGIARSGLTIVILMGVAALDAIVEVLIRSGLDKATPAACISNAGMPSQQVVRAPVATLANTVASSGLSHPAVTIIGRTVDALLTTDTPGGDA